MIYLGEPIRTLPQKNCSYCPRLVAFREKLRAEKPREWFNAPVPCFGEEAKTTLLVLGLAPGLKGANRTGRVFTGDGAGVTLYRAMLKHNFATGEYDARPDDSLKLKKAMVSNVVRCVPPENKPLGSEIKNCQRFVKARLASLPKLKLVIALGHVAHNSLLEACGEEKKRNVFQHGKVHQLEEFMLLDSYHCSRRNFSTKILTPRTFEAIFQKAQRLLLNG